MRTVYLIAAVMLTGCAATPKYGWRNPTLDGELSSRQGAIDSAECQASAMNAVPLPIPPAQQVVAKPATGRTYTVNGTTTAYSPNGGAYNSTFNGTVTEQQAFDPGAALAEGAAFAEDLI